MMHKSRACITPCRHGQTASFDKLLLSNRNTTTHRHRCSADTSSKTMAASVPTSAHCRIATTRQNTLVVPVRICAFLATFRCLNKTDHKLSFSHVSPTKKGASPLHFFLYFLYSFFPQPTDAPEIKQRHLLQLFNCPNAVPHQAIVYPA